MKVEERKILDFLEGNNKTYVIPPFQRNYSWDEKQCRTLFNDICSLYEKQNELQTEIKKASSKYVRDALKGESENCIHYLGTIIWYEGENNDSSYRECILVDGQQRLTSVLLLLCAIRDIISDEIKKNSITEDYLKNKNRNNGYSVRLKQTEYDDECFRNIVEGLKLNNEESNVKKRYDTFKELLKEKESEIPPEDILEMLNYVKIVSINLEKMSLEWIQTVFEKINSTGKPLSAADLIRNYLLIANDNREQTRLYKDYWLKIEKKVGTENILKFIVIYLVICTCKADDISETTLYSQFKDYFNNEINNTSDDDDKREEIREKIMTDMLALSEYYEWLCFDRCDNEKIKRNIKYIKKLEATNFYSVCVYCLSKLSKENENEMEKIFDLFTDFLIRYRIVSPSSGGGALNSVISDLLRGFTADENSKDYIPLKYDSILYKLSNSRTPNGRFPTDEEFKAKLIQSENYKFRLILLLRIEDVKKPNDFTINIDEASVEHLLPQSVVDGKKRNAQLWRKYLGEEKQVKRLCNEYMHCIGNLALLPKKVNSSISNSIWSEKIQALKEYSNISTTNGIADDYPEWKEDNIKERNKRMAQIACESITSPLKRDIPYQPYEDFVSLSDLENVTSKKIDSLMYNNEEVDITGSSQGVSWKDFLKAVCKTAYEVDAVKFNGAYQGNKFNRKQSTPLISKEKINEKYELVDNIDFYVLSNGLNANNAFKYAKHIIEACGLNSDDFKVKYKTDSDDE